MQQKHILAFVVLVIAADKAASMTQDNYDTTYAALNEYFLADAEHVPATVRLSKSAVSLFN